MPEDQNFVELGGAFVLDLAIASDLGAPRSLRSGEWRGVGFRILQGRRSGKGTGESLPDPFATANGTDAPPARTCRARKFQPYLEFLQPSANAAAPGLRSGNLWVTLRESQGNPAKMMRCYSKSNSRSIICKLLT